MDKMWAATWVEWDLKYFHTVRMYRCFVHDDLLKSWFQPDEYSTPKSREICLRRLWRKGLRVVKVGVTAI